MAQLRRDYPEIQRRNAEILQVTHSSPDEARRYVKHYELSFPYLCDPAREVHELYGIRLIEPGLLQGAGSFVACSAVAATDLLKGEGTFSPAPFFKRHGFKDSPQGIFIVDRDGVIRSAHTAGPISAIPSGADLVRELDALP